LVHPSIHPSILLWVAPTLPVLGSSLLLLINSRLKNPKQPLVSGISKIESEKPPDFSYAKTSKRIVGFHEVKEKNRRFSGRLFDISHFYFFKS
jgi:hypothetical protein